MVTACKAYITDGGYSRVWEQDSPTVIKKIQVCVVWYNLSGITSLDIEVFLKECVHILLWN